MFKVFKEDKNNVVDFQEYKNNLEKKKQEMDAKEFQAITIATLNNEIDSMLDELEDKFKDKENYIIKLFEIKDFIANIKGDEKNV